MLSAQRECRPFGSSGSRSSRNAWVAGWWKRSMIANTITTFVTFPLDTIKTRQQSLGRAAGRGLGYTRGLFNGVVPTLLVSVPCCGLYFMTYEALQKQNVDKSLVGDICCALGAQILSGALMVPADILKVNLQAGTYASPKAAAAAICEGVTWSSSFSAFQQRLLISYLRDFSFACIQMTLYVNLHRQGDPIAAFAGAIAAGTASLVTTPVDTIRTRHMLAASGDPKAAPHLNYFAGVTPRVLLSALGGFIFFRCYEAAKPLVQQALQGTEIAGDFALVG